MWFRSAPVSDQARPRRGGPKARTLVKLTAGLVLTLLALFGAGFWLTGGTIVSPGDNTTEPPRLRNQSEKIYMLELINKARAGAGVPPVVMGTNDVAQIQAEKLLRDCVLSHWGTDGLKPYMRYSLAGGYQVTQETATTSNECGLVYTWLQWNGRPEEMIRESVQSLLSSPIHQKVLLNPTYQQVNIGLAWDRNTFKTVEHFEGDYTELHRLPVITDGDLTFAGRLKEGHEFNPLHPLGVRVYYDPEPRALTQGQLIRTSCYGEGEKIASIESPSPQFLKSYTRQTKVREPVCTNPYEISASARRPYTQADTAHAWQQRRAESEQIRNTSVSFLVLEAQDMTVEGREFTVAADLSELLDQRGPGIYTVVLLAALEGWGKRDIHPIVQYSVFHQVDAPGGYSPLAGGAQ